MSKGRPAGQVSVSAGENRNQGDVETGVYYVRSWLPVVWAAVHQAK